jgi:hypothetical protein
MNDILMDARFQIARAYQSGGAVAALAAVGAGSIRLYRHVVNDCLTWRSVFKTLLQVSINLRLVNVFGRPTVRTAIYAGPTFYNDLAEAA